MSAAVVLASVVAVALLLIALRLRARRQRRHVRLRLMSGRTDEATPQRVAKLLEVIHQLLLRRWGLRLLTGQPGIALEYTLTPTSAGVEARLSIVLRTTRCSCAPSAGACRPPTATCS